MSCGHMDGVMAENGPPTLGSVELDPPVVLIPENINFSPKQVIKREEFVVLCTFNVL